MLLKNSNRILSEIFGSQRAPMVYFSLRIYVQYGLVWGSAPHSHSKIHTCRSFLKPNHTLAHKTQENSLPLTCHREISHIATPNLKRNEIKSYHQSIKRRMSVFVSSFSDYCKHLHMMQSVPKR